MVLPDFRLPLLSGDAVIKAARAKRCRTPVIMITGLIDERPAWVRTGPESVRVLTKPFSLVQLQREMVAALGLPGGAVA